MRTAMAPAHPASRAAVAVVVATVARVLAAAPALSVAAALSLSACAKGSGAPKHREPSPARDKACVEPERPKAYFYPAENRTDYRPDDPWKDGCAMLVPDHLFCCPAAGGDAGR